MTFSKAQVTPPAKPTLASRQTFHSGAPLHVARTQSRKGQAFQIPLVLSPRDIIDIKRVGEEMGVRYVLEGSLRQGAGRVRVSAQLIEAASGNHIWAERYDRQI